jgi:CubicO group peptidase (beta-lactamase class C family)
MAGNMRAMMVVMALGSIGCTAEALAAPGDLQARAEAYLKTAYPDAGPGAAVIIVDDGKTVFAGGQGMADVEARTKITPATVFRLGSITKQFTSAVIMQLVEEGKLSLDDPLSKFVPGYPQPGASATVRQLLNHTSGVQSYTGIPGFMGDPAKLGRAYTTDEMIAVFKDVPAPSKPGERWSYNNSGYVLLGAIIEKLTGKPWHQAIEERIAQPLGLKTIRYGTAEASIPNMAKGYRMGESGVERSAPLHMSIPHAAGALVGSVEDLAKWGLALHRGKLVKPASYTLMTQPAKLTDGKTEPYGFGLQLAETRDRPAVGHGGGIPGFSTYSLYVPSEDLYVAVFANSQNPASSPEIVTRRLAAMAMNDPYPEMKRAEMPAASFEPLFGVYAAEGGERAFYARAGKLFTRRKGGNEMEVFPAGEDRFFYGPESLTWFKVTRDPSGKHVMEMYPDGAKTAARALRSGPVPVEAPPVMVPAGVLARYQGTYALGSRQAKVVLGADGGLTAQLTGQPVVRLIAEGPAEFRVEGAEAKVAFVMEGDKAARMIVKQNGQEIPAQRVPD